MVDPIMPHISQSGYIIAFAIFFVFFNILGLMIHGRFLGAFFSMVVTIMNLVLGFIPFWVAIERLMGLVLITIAVQMLLNGVTHYLGRS